MKSIIVVVLSVLAASAMLFTSACSTTNTVAQNACIASRIVTPFAIDAGLQYAVSDPANRLVIEHQIFVVADSIVTLSTNGTVSVDAVTAAFNVVTNPTLKLILNPILGLYETYYAQLQGNNTVSQATQILGCIAADAKAATTPAAVEKSQEKGLALYRKN
jgi:hypothetical protein